MVFHLQQEGTEPLIFGRTELTNHVTLQWQELVRIQLVVFRELLRTLFEDNFVGRLPHAARAALEALSESKSTMFCVMVI
ncbi:hypothetical protein BANRA_05490 [Escherichia coli]|uniref:Uncharacterized protein n=1 Tax=Escherichia coli TaxID=562 RepID=A0A3P5HCB1_ECOLX|nr:hypothetical protein BANRA_05490 [Escherichia coli]